MQEWKYRHEAVGKAGGGKYRKGKTRGGKCRTGNIGTKQ